MPKKDRIRKWALELGFDAVGFAPPRIDKRDQERFQAFIKDRAYENMAWMARNTEKRIDPRVLWPEVKSVVVLGLNYAPAPSAIGSECRDCARISVYARNQDYHDIMKKRLKKLAAAMTAHFACRVKVFVDTAPVLEKALAAKSGIGWIGKQTQIISRQFGPWLFLGEVFTDLALPPDPPEKNRCGSCNRCLAACPTGAISPAYHHHPCRCLSYLTIEHKDAIPQAHHQAVGNRVYGCDECLLACPFQRFAPPTKEAGFKPRPELLAPRWADLLALNDPEFRRLFSGSPIRRIGSERFLRNVRIGHKNTMI